MSEREEEERRSGRGADKKEETRKSHKYIEGWDRSCNYIKEATHC